MASKLSLFLTEAKRREVLSVAIVFILLAGCRSAEDAPLTADMPIHLEEHLDDATIIGSEAPADLRQPMEWHFDEPQPDWRTATPYNPTIPRAEVSRPGDALRVTLTEQLRDQRRNWEGGIYIDLPALTLGDWDMVVIRARSENEASGIAVGFNLKKGSGTSTSDVFPFEAERWTPLVRGETVLTYWFQADGMGSSWEGPWKQLGLWFNSGEPGSIDILSVTVVPVDAKYSESAGVGLPPGDREGPPVIYVRAPGRIDFTVDVPDEGHLDLALGVVGGDIHSPDEYIDLPSLAQRAKLTFLMLCRIAEGKTR